MTLLLRGEGLRWRNGDGRLDFAIPAGARIIVVGGSPERRLAFRDLIGGRGRGGFEAGRLFWQGVPAEMLSARRRRAWRRSVAGLWSDPSTSLLPQDRPISLLREVGGRGASVERFVDLAHLPRSAVAWPVSALSGVMRAHLLYALALMRAPALLTIGDLSPFFAEEVWDDLLRRWLERCPPRVALVAFVPRPLPRLEADECISLDF